MTVPADERFPLKLPIRSIDLSIVIAGLIIGLAVVASQFVGRYQIAAGVGADSQPLIWRLNARTGEIQICDVRARPAPRVAGEAKNRFDSYDFTPDRSAPIPAPPAAILCSLVGQSHP
jgi:hypothetical protein